MAETPDKSQILDNQSLLNRTRDTTHEIRDTSDERPLDPGDWSFMQNKPNFKIGKMNATSCTTNSYGSEL